MKHSVHFLAADTFDSEVHHPELDRFDRIRTLLINTGLMPTPAIYELFWRYFEDDGHELSRAIYFAIAVQSFDQRMATALHRIHCIKWHDD